VFGTSVPGFVWPWVLLIIIQVFFSNVSFFGHMAGILVGMAYARDWLAPFIPSNPYFTYFEETRILSWMVRIPSYVNMPGIIALPTAFEPSLPGSFPSANVTPNNTSVSSRSAGFLDRIRAILSSSSHSAAGYQTLGGDDETLLAADSDGGHHQQQPSPITQ
jgi:hypothetical protein